VGPDFGPVFLPVISRVVPVPYREIVRTLQDNPDVLTGLVEIFCDCLAGAHEQINTLAVHDILRRLGNVLGGLASKIGRPFGDMIQIPTYLTQEAARLQPETMAILRQLLSRSAESSTKTHQNPV